MMLAGMFCWLSTFDEEKSILKCKVEFAEEVELGMPVPLAKSNRLLPSKDKGCYEKQF